MTRPNAVSFDITLTCAVLTAVLYASSVFAGTISYNYDPLGRATSATYSDGSCATFTYDAAGNRTLYTGSNGFPAAKGVSISVNENQPLTFDPRIGNPTCTAISIYTVGSPTDGTATVVNPGGVAVTYTPNTGYTGPDSFGYTITDGTNYSSQTISVNVKAATLTPTATNGSASFFAEVVPPARVTPTTTTNVTPLVSSPYGYLPAVLSVTQGAQGAVTISGNNVIYTYHTSVGFDLTTSDNFTYTVEDPLGHTATANVSVSIVVTTNQ